MVELALIGFGLCVLCFVALGVMFHVLIGLILLPFKIAFALLKCLAFVFLALPLAAVVFALVVAALALAVVLGILLLIF